MGFECRCVELGVITLFYCNLDFLVKFEDEIMNLNHLEDEISRRIISINTM